MKIHENIFKNMKQIMYPLSKKTKNIDKQPLLIYENMKAITVNAYKIDPNLTGSILVVPRKEKEALERR